MANVKEPHVLLPIGMRIKTFNVRLIQYGEPLPFRV